MDYSYCIVIVTYNRLKLLKECIEHALNQTSLAKKVIVVDNNSSDGTREYLDENYAKDSRVLISHEKENLGGAGGFHKGVVLAAEMDVDWIMLIDDDAILDYACMEKLNPHTAKNKVKAYACTVYCEGQIDVSHRRSNVTIPISAYDNGEFACELATFCGLMIEKNIIEKIGFPKSEYFIWFDDSEYCMRINEHSKIVVRPEAFLVHKTQLPSTEGIGVLSWKSYYGVRNSIDAYKSHKQYRQLWVTVRRIVKRIFICQIKGLKHKELRYEKVLRREALHDGLWGKLGKNQKYLP